MENQYFCVICGFQLQENQAFCPKCGHKRDGNVNEQGAISRTNQIAHKKSGLTTAAFVLGIVAISTSLLPIINTASFIIGILAVVFGFVTLFKEQSKAKPIISLILGIFAIALTILSQTYYLNLLDKAQQNIKDAIKYNTNSVYGDKTDLILEKYLDVKIGKFSVEKDSYFEKTKLKITVKNKGDKKSSFNIKIEAVDKDGSRLETDMVFVQDLNAGQSMNLEAFTYVSQEKIKEVKNATFKILEVLKY